MSAWDEKIPVSPSGGTDTNNAGNPLSTLQKLFANLSSSGKPGTGMMPMTSSPVIGQAVSPAMPPGMAPMIGQPSASGPQTKMDPRASVGSLPSPIPTPERGPMYNRTSGDDIFQSSLQPRQQAVFNGVQGISQVMGNFFQKRDKEQHTEAANAAQNLMQAIESGDYSAANDIIHQNEGLFNKVYKGWLQKNKEKGQQDKGKQSADLQGFESGLSDYFAGKNPQAPQPPTTLGASAKNPGGYYLPKATPQQMLGKQQASGEAQATQQDPNRALQSQLMSPEIRAAQLSKAGFITTPEDNMKYQMSYNELMKNQNQLKVSENEIKIVQTQLENAKLVGETDTAKLNAALQTAQIRNQTLQDEVELGKTRIDLLNDKALNPNGLPTRTVMQKYRAASDALNTLNGAVKDGKARALTLQERQTLQGQLTQAGLASAGKKLTDMTYSLNPMAPGTEDLLDLVNKQIENYTSAYPSLERQPNDKGVIVIKPEDLKDKKVEKK